MVNESNVVRWRCQVCPICTIIASGNKWISKDVWWGGIENALRACNIGADQDQCRVES